MAQLFRCTLIPIVFLIALSSCNVTQYLSPGERLYGGIKKIVVTDKQSQDKMYRDKAIAKAESTLQYDTNGLSFNFGRLSFSLPPFRTWLYLKTKQDTTFGARLIRKFGSPPILLSMVNPELRAKVTQNILNEFGYLNATVFSKNIPNKNDSLNVAVAYTISLGHLYRCDSIIPLSPITLLDSTKFYPNKYSSLIKGMPLSADLLDKDRHNISDSLRCHGFYYFKPDMILYKADTLMKLGAVVLKTTYQEGIPHLVLSRWRMGKIDLRLMDNSLDPSVGDVLLRDTLHLAKHIVLHYNNSPLVRAKVLDLCIRLRSDSLYSQRNEELTLQALSNLGAFSSTEFLFKRRDSLVNGKNVLDLNILLRPDKPWDVTFQSLFKSKSNNYIGPGVNFSLAKRNIFGGGETLSLSAYGSYEWQKGRSPISNQAFRINSYQFGGDLSLVFPALLFPGKLDSYYSYPTSTELRLSSSLLNRASLYTLHSFGFNMAYDFRPNESIHHHIQPLGLSFTLLSNYTKRFKKLLKHNPVLGLSFRNQFIPQAGYTFTYDNVLDPNRTHHIWMSYSISEAGNVLNGVMALSGKPYNKQKKLFGVPFAQFVKGTAEIRYTYAIDMNQSIATRFATGVIYSYGNARTAPFMEQFYVGGANSIRAFTVRSVGPGRYRPSNNSPYAFMDQVGDFKLEANIEYRGRLDGALQGALFIDTGNVWLLNPDPTRIGGSLKEIRSVGDMFNQIAVGTGVGLRYDLGYIVLRFDVGIGLHLPYQTLRKGWYNIPHFKDAIGIHLAVGYPF